MGPVGPTGPVGALGAPVSEEMRNRIMADVESMRPPKAEPLVPIFSWRNLAILALLLLFIGWMTLAFSLMDDDTPRDAHGVPCTVSLECR